MLVSIIIGFVLGYLFGYYLNKQELIEHLDSNIIKNRIYQHENKCYQFIPKPVIGPRILHRHHALK